MLAPADAVACPLCDSDRAEQVRAELFSADSILVLLAVIAPFVVLAAILPVVHYVIQPGVRASTAAAGRAL